MGAYVSHILALQEEVVVRVVDSVLEDVRIGLELNISKLNQRRVSSIKFIGEMYTYQLLESNVIFRTLYLLLQFGANPDGKQASLQRLVFTVLDKSTLSVDLSYGGRVDVDAVDPAMKNA